MDSVGDKPKFPLRLRTLVYCASNRKVRPIIPLGSVLSYMIVLKAHAVTYIFLPKINV